MDPTSGDEVRADLVARLVEHGSLVCQTGHEGPIADAVTAHYADRDVARVGNSVAVRGPTGEDRPLVVFAGHLDVVPPTEVDREVRPGVRDGVAVVEGRGT